jgi:Zn-dependent protease with chaperone function
MLKNLINNSLFSTALLVTSGSLAMAVPQTQPTTKVKVQNSQNQFLSKLQEIKDSTISYWQPHIQPHIHRANEYWTDKFNSEIHPFIIHRYSVYYDRYGSKISDKVFKFYEYLSPILSEQYSSTTEYWYSKNPEMFDDLVNVPTPVKKNYEKLIFYAWKILNESPDKLEALSDQAKSSVAFTQILLNARKVPSDHKLKQQLARLNDLLNDLRPFAKDPEMRSCYEVHIVDLSMINSFNTGCNIFVAFPVTEILNDDELRAVLAHEISHGDQGHSIKTIVELSKQTGIHLGFLIMDELDWLVTGRYSPRLTQVIKEGNAPIIFEAFGNQAPQVEIDADLGGGDILKKSGRTPNNLISALIKLTDASIIEKEQSNRDKQESLRKYPDLQKRVQEISDRFGI